jgi:hypothetical protein
VSKSIKSIDDVIASDWVNDPSDGASWENGLKWISKAIVSDKDLDSKEDLKQQLEDHIRFALCSPISAVREVGFFYCLAWKRMDLLEDYDDEDDAKALLLAALKKLYDSHSFKRLSLNLFIFPSWRMSLSCVSALVSKRLAPPVVALLGKALAKPEKMLRTLGAIEELLVILGIAPDDVQELLSDFWKERAAFIQEAFEREDYALAHERLALFSTLGRNFSGFATDYCQLLERHLTHVPIYLLPTALSWMLVWKCQNCVNVAVKRLHETDRDLFTQTLILHFSRLNLGLEETRRLVDFAFKAGEQAQQGAHELLFLCMDKGAPSPLLGQAIRAGLEDKARRNETYSVFSLLVERMEVRSTDILGPRSEYLSKLWTSVEGSTDCARWQEVLETFEQIVATATDPFLESEFFLPLLHDCFLSPTIELTRFALNFAGKREGLISALKEWLAEPNLQEELIAGLKDKDARQQIHTLNRLLTMYGHLPVPSEYLSKGLREFEQDLAASSADEEFKQRMLRTSRRILKSVTANG